MNMYVRNFAILFCLFILSGCGESQDNGNMLRSAEIQETDFVESGHHEVSENEDEIIDVSISESETLQGIPIEENGVMEIYAGGREMISVAKDIMIAQISPQEILKGKPITYDRFKIDGWFFEWLISDYFDDDNWFFEDGVLVISRESDAEDTQIIHVKAEGGYAT